MWRVDGITHVSLSPQDRYSRGDKVIVTGYGGSTEEHALLPRVLSSKGVVSVRASSHHTACVTKDGEVFTWGEENYWKLLGPGEDETNQQTPKRVETLVGVTVTMVSCGSIQVKGNGEWSMEFVVR
jgi:alpha-tubulin suppressor-like RCC1 family protein